MTCDGRDELTDQIDSLKCRLAELRLQESINRARDVAIQDQYDRAYAIGRNIRIGLIAVVFPFVLVGLLGTGGKMRGPRRFREPAKVDQRDYYAEVMQSIQSERAARDLRDAEQSQREAESAQLAQLAIDAEVSEYREKRNASRQREIARLERRNASYAGRSRFKRDRLRLPKPATEPTETRTETRSNPIWLGPPVDKNGSYFPTTTKLKARGVKSWKYN